MDHNEWRFGGVGRLYGTEGLDRIRRAHVCVVGLGGVGSWAVEALARSGIGALTLVDLDDVCISNVNRQLHALDGELGRPKVEVMARRVRAINPGCVVHPMQAFFLKSNAGEILQTRFDYVLDAFDSPSRKCVLIALCRERGIPVITSGAAAGRRDPTKVEVIDLSSGAIIGAIENTPGVHGIAIVPSLHRGFATNGKCRRECSGQRGGSRIRCCGGAG